VLHWFLSNLSRPKRPKKVTSSRFCGVPESNYLKIHRVGLECF